MIQVEEEIKCFFFILNAIEEVYFNQIQFSTALFYVDVFCMRYDVRRRRRV